MKSTLLGAVPQLFIPTRDDTVIRATTVGVVVLGMIGVASMAPFIPELIKRVLPVGKPIRMPMPMLVVVALAQTSLLVILCAWVGARLGPPLGLRVRLLDATYQGSGQWATGATAVAAGFVVGITGGLAAFSSAKPLITYLRSTPLAVRLLYGGFTEEVLVRWGLLAVVGWFVAHDFLGITAGATGAVIFTSVLVTNMIFAGAHLPLLRAARISAPGRAAGVIFFVSLPWGWLCWTYGLESAILAHMTFHLTIEALARAKDQS